MSQEIKNDKDFVIAKMNHRTALLTTIIGAIVTLVGVFTPIYLVNNSNKSEAASDTKTTEVEKKESTTPTPSPTHTPTPTPAEEEKGKGKNK